MSGPPVRHRVRELLEPVVAAAGYDLEDVDITPAGRRRLVRLIVDRDGGVSLDDVADVSRSAGAVLDAADVMGDSPYVLEVSSPGVDRPLTEPRHWRRAAGRRVHAALVGGGQVAGRVVTADGDGALIDLGTERRHYGYHELGTARIDIEFGHVADPEVPDRDGGAPE